MRRLWPTLLTGSLTALLLVALALPARDALRGARAAATGATPPAPTTRLFGIYGDPWHVDSWARDTGVAPDLLAAFEAFSVTRPLDPALRETAARGIRRLLLTWEPWQPVDAALGVRRQYAPQPAYRNRDIAAGAQDAYLKRMARSFARFPGVIYLRYAHEMNGTWYPWSHDPSAYVAAWRHVTRVVRALSPNVRMVWSPNPNLFEPAEGWRANLRRYWPGRAYVDVVGSTVIDFGGAKDYPVARFRPRLRALRRDYALPVLLAETNTAFDGRLPWLRHLRMLLHDSPWIIGVAWSQLPSRGARHMRAPGDLSWDVRDDPPAAAWLKAIAADGRH